MSIKRIIYLQLLLFFAAFSLKAPVTKLVVWPTQKIGAVEYCLLTYGKLALLCQVTGKGEYKVVNPEEYQWSGAKFNCFDEVALVNLFSGSQGSLNNLFNEVNEKFKALSGLSKEWLTSFCGVDDINLGSKNRYSIKQYLDYSQEKITEFFNQPKNQDLLQESIKNFIDGEITEANIASKKQSFERLKKFLSVNDLVKDKPLIGLNLKTIEVKIAASEKNIALQKEMRKKEEALVQSEAAAAKAVLDAKAQAELQAKNDIAAAVQKLESESKEQMDALQAQLEAAKASGDVAAQQKIDAALQDLKQKTETEKEAAIAKVKEELEQEKKDLEDKLNLEKEQALAKAKEDLQKDSEATLLAEKEKNKEFEAEIKKLAAENEKTKEEAKKNKEEAEKAKADLSARENSGGGITNREKALAAVVVCGSVGFLYKLSRAYFQKSLPAQEKPGLQNDAAAPQLALSKKKNK